MTEAGWRDGSAGSWTINRRDRQNVISQPSHRDAHVLTLGTCKYLHYMAKEELKLQMELGVANQLALKRLSSGSNAITRGLQMANKQAEGLSLDWPWLAFRCRKGSRWAKGSRWSLKLERQGIQSPQSFQSEHSPAHTLTSAHWDLENRKLIHLW